MSLGGSCKYKWLSRRRGFLVLFYYFLIIQNNFEISKIDVRQFYSEADILFFSTDSSNIWREEKYDMASHNKLWSDNCDVESERKEDKFEAMQLYWEKHSCKKTS